jgi:hypothetical protein
MPICVLQDETPIAIPCPIESLDWFRQWASSEDFPETGRIDFIDGVIEVDPVTGDLFEHGSPKAEVARMLMNRVKTQAMWDTSSWTALA